MFEDFLDHKCNIYHMQDDAVNAGYGIIAAETRSAETTCEADIPCHFHIKSSGLSVIQHEPYSSVDGNNKLSLGSGTDIRMNDIVEDCETHLKFRAGIPKRIHGSHHIIVTLTREKGAPNSI